MSEPGIGSLRGLVESVVTKLGLDPAKVLRSESDEHVSFAVKRGSATVVVAAGRAPDGHLFVRVAAPVILLPDDASKHQALFQRLLELNAEGLSNAAFGLLDGRVVAVSERPAAGIDSDEIEQMVRHLAAVADTFDDRLAADFGAQRAGS